MGDITNNFSKSEFWCPCLACTEGGKPVEISLGLVDKLQLIRDKIDFGMTINSGVRCEAHNKAIGGSPNSSHLLGLAADIKIHNAREGFLLVEQAYLAGFKRIGDKYDNFVHLDVDQDKGQRVRW